MCDVKTYLSTLRIKVSATSSSAVTMQSVCELKKDSRQNSVTPYMSSLDFTDEMREIIKQVLSTFRNDVCDRLQPVHHQQTQLCRPERYTHDVMKKPLEHPALHVQ
jgi:hypothetical protein